MRLFFALDLPIAAQKAIAAFQAKNKTLPFRASWLDPFQMHLTLAFLGEQPEERLASLCEIGSQVAKHNAPTTLRTAGLGGFPAPAQARVLWLGVEANADLEAMAIDLWKGLENRGFTPAAKPFTAHFTLARFAHLTDIGPFKPSPAPLKIQIHELVLYESHLNPKGARYEKRASFPFAYTATQNIT